MMRIPPSPPRIVMSGTFTVQRLEMRIPGTEPSSSQAVACRSTSPMMRWPAPATQRSAAAWKTSVPTIRGMVSG